MRITNIVSVSSVNTRLDLMKICRENTNIVYNPQKFTAATWRHKKIHGTLLIFPNGKITHLGPPTGESPRVHVRRYARVLHKQGHPVRLSPIRTVSMSGVHQLAGPIDLYDIPGSSYEPELINAAILKRDGVTLNIFYTGKVIITGIRHIDSVYPILLELELLAR